MSEQPRTRQELYDRIRATSKLEFILEDMIRLGFWPAEGEMPEDPAEDIRRQAELRKELKSLRAKNSRLYNEQALLKELKQKRLKESRQRQKETKERRAQERQAKAEAWRQKKEREIVYLGEGVSGGLNETTCDEARLQQYGLPRLDSAAEIASAMSITVGELRFLSFARKTSKTSHYVRFKIAKKTGGERLISAPMPRLKSAQQWILETILNRVTPHDAAHGFRHERSIVTNARPHVGAEVVINLDLKDFFPTVSYKRVKGLFRSLGYSEATATIFGLLCTEPEIVEVELDSETYFVATSERFLPQGAPTSPAISNLICRRLDRRLTKMAIEHGFTYTRYADDLSFSASGHDLRNICNILGQTESIVSHEGFLVHPDKTRVLRQSRQQEVTGVVVNQHLNVSRKTLKRFRAVLYQIERDGPEGKHWGASPNVLASVQGFANFVYMVNPEKGAELKERVKALINRYAPEMNRPPKPAYRDMDKADSPLNDTSLDTSVDSDVSTDSASDEDSLKKKWWKIW
ncbi:reverse transcriptase domain-containing protein [Anaerolineales bacterium HSG25]|nr:reverse transcriptase domain-containing protein [Anaerolineales bacterium HSG25]